MTKILMVLSAAHTLTLADGSERPTGFWAEEVAVSHQVLRNAGFEIEIATPGGGPAVVDLISLDARGGVPEDVAASARTYLHTLEPQLTRPRVLAELLTHDYDAVYLPGGHAPMADLATDADLGAILARADENGRIVATLCHGAAGLLGARSPDGSFRFAGRRLTAFTDEEEKQGGLGDLAPWLLAGRLTSAGLEVTSGAPWSDTVVVDRNLISGQNPASSATTAATVIQALKH